MCLHSPCVDTLVLQSRCSLSWPRPPRQVFVPTSGTLLFLYPISRLTKHSKGKPARLFTFGPSANDKPFPFALSLHSERVLCISTTDWPRWIRAVFSPTASGGASAALRINLSLNILFSPPPRRDWSPYSSPPRTFCPFSHYMPVILSSSPPLSSRLTLISM